MRQSLDAGRIATVTLLAVFSLVACTPTFNWRDIQPESSALRMSFPCKPSTRSRQVLLAGKPVVMQLHSCDAGGATFALTVAELDEPASVPQALRQLRQAASSNIEASSVASADFVVKGVLPAPGTGRVHAVGRLPDGTVTRQDAAFFAIGARVYQATVLGKSEQPVGAEVTDTFFDGITPVR